MMYKKPITGFEPVTSSLLVTRSNQLSYTGLGTILNVLSLNNSNKFYGFDVAQISCYECIEAKYLFPY